MLHVYMKRKKHTHTHYVRCIDCCMIANTSTHRLCFTLEQFPFVQKLWKVCHNRHIRRTTTVWGSALEQLLQHKQLYDNNRYVQRQHTYNVGLVETSFGFFNKNVICRTVVDNQTIHHTVSYRLNDLLYGMSSFSVDVIGQITKTFKYSSKQLVTNVPHLRMPPCATHP